MSLPPGVAARPSSRQRFRQRRARAFAATGGALLVLGLAGAILLAPGRLGALRLGGVSLVWWTAIGVLALEIGAVVLGLATPRDR